jgi:hypothetical protein
MKKQIIRAVSAFTVVAVGALGLEFFGERTEPASAATAISVQCDGVDGDVAGTVRGAPNSSKQMVALLGTVTGSAGLPPLPVNVTANIPAKVRKDSGPFDVSFAFSIGLDSKVVDPVKNLLKKTSLDIVNATIGVAYSGAQTGTLETTIASQRIDLNQPNASTTITVSGKVPSDKSGRVFFRPGVFRLGIKIDGDAAGIAVINTLTLTCSAQGLIGTSNVQVPGAPNTPDVLDVPVIGGQMGVVDIGSKITPDDGNPILPGTLGFINNPNGAVLNGNLLYQQTPESGGFFTSEMQVCGAPRTVPGTPGVDSVQELRWGDTYFAKPLNAHPLWMTLKFKDAETAPIVLSQASFLGFPVPLFGNEGFHNLAGTFAAPPASQIQAALEALPTIGSGNVSVTGEGPYTITFVGNLGKALQPKIEIGKWITGPLDFSGYAAIQAIIRDRTTPKEPDPNAPPDPAATSDTVDQLNAKLLAGQITFDQWSAQFGSALVNSIIAGIDISATLKFVNDIFPQPPTVAETVVGEAPVPDSSTGPLCSQFQVRFVAVPLAFFAALAAKPPSVQGCTVTRVRQRVRVRGKIRTRVVTKRTGNCASVKKATAKKTTKKKATIKRKTTTAKKKSTAVRRR